MQCELMRLSMLAPTPPTRDRVGNFPCLEWQACPRGRNIKSLKCACAIRIVYVCTLITIIIGNNFYFALKIIVVARAQYSACRARY